MKVHLFESVKELNEYLQARKGWRKPIIQHNFQVVDTVEGKEKTYTIVDRFCVIER